LIYHPSGAVTINADYYRRILKEKEHTNLAATPQMFQSTAKKTPSFSIQGPSF
jgi:hypothetical protein